MPPTMWSPITSSAARTMPMTALPNATTCTLCRSTWEQSPIVSRSPSRFSALSTIARGNTDVTAVLWISMACSWRRAPAILAWREYGIQQGKEEWCDGINNECTPWLLWQWRQFLLKTCNRCITVLSARKLPLTMTSLQTTQKCQQRRQKKLEACKAEGQKGHWTETPLRPVALTTARTDAHTNTKHKENKANEQSK